jgi:hypothetical protein
MVGPCKSIWFLACCISLRLLLILSIPHALVPPQLAHRTRHWSGKSGCRLAKRPFASLTAPASAWRHVLARCCLRWTLQQSQGRRSSWRREGRCLRPQLALLWC